MEQVKKRMTFTPDDETMEKLISIKQTKFFDRPWSEVVSHIVRLGVKEEMKRKA